jgi:hypothetical protein
MSNDNIDFSPVHRAAMRVMNNNKNADVKIWAQRDKRKAGFTIYMGVNDNIKTCLGRTIGQDNLEYNLRRLHDKHGIEIK